MTPKTEIHRPRFIVFISRSSEREEYTSLAPEADFIFASYSDLGPDAIQMDPKRLDASVEFFSRLHAERPFCAVLNRKEKCVVPAAVLANSLGLPPILAKPELARDKYEMRRALNGAAAFPGTVLIRDAGDLTSVPDKMFPCVLKPRFGFNSRSAVRAANRRELDAAYADQYGRYRLIQKQDGTNSDFVVEEYIPGTEHTVESLLKDGRVLFHLLSDKMAMSPPFLVEVGDHMPSLLPPAAQQACMDAAGNALAALGIRNGWTHTEVKLQGEQAVVVEAAARMGGGYFEDLIQMVFGIHRMSVLIRMYLGNEPAQTPAPRVHAAARRVVVYGAERIRQLHNPEILTRDSRIKLVWPRSADEINRKLAGPPFDFNNTLFEFIALGEGARDAEELAAATIAEADLSGV